MPEVDPFIVEKNCSGEWLVQAYLILAGWSYMVSPKMSMTYTQNVECGMVSIMERRMHRGVYPFDQSGSR